MDIKDRIHGLLDKAKFFSGLDVNEEFNQWREQVVEARLLAYVRNALVADVDTEAGKIEALNAIRAYQQLHYVTKDVFKTWELTEKQLLKQIENTNDSSDKPA